MRWPGRRGIAAVLHTTEPPTVESVALGDIGGVTFLYAQNQGVPTGVNWSHAEVTKDGNTYAITGSAMGEDPANPMQVVYKVFDINVTCP